MITHTQQSYPWHIVYAQHPTDGRTIAIRVGELGYHPVRTPMSITDLYHVGGGNWFGGELRDSRIQVVGGVSFNGRINSLQDHNRFSAVGPRA